MVKNLFSSMILFLPSVASAQMEAFSPKFFSSNNIDSIYVSSDLLNKEGDNSMCLKETFNYDKNGRTIRNTVFTDCKRIDVKKDFVLQEGALHHIGMSELIGGDIYKTEATKNSNKKNVYKYTLKDQYNGMVNYTAEYDAKGQLIRTSQTDAKKKGKTYSTEYSYNDKGLLYSIVEWVDDKITRSFKISFNDAGKIVSMTRNAGLAAETTYAYSYKTDNLIMVDVVNKIEDREPMLYKYELKLYRH